MSNVDRFTIKYFYTTGSECTSSLSAVNACLSQSNNNVIYKYEISGSTDTYPSASNHSDMASTRMSEAYQIKYIPTFVLEQYGNVGQLGMEFNRVREDVGYKVTQNDINGWFNYYSSSGG